MAAVYHLVRVNVRCTTECGRMGWGRLGGWAVSRYLPKGERWGGAVGDEVFLDAKRRSYRLEGVSVG